MFEVVTPAKVKRKDREVPSFSAFITFLDANAGHWCKVHSYTNAHSGNQQAYRANKKWGDNGYTFTSRKEEGKVSLYGKKTVGILD